MFFLGIDGGGTKTAFLLINENGDIIEAKTIARRRLFVSGGDVRW